MQFWVKKQFCDVSPDGKRFYFYKSISVTPISRWTLWWHLLLHHSGLLNLNLLRYTVRYHLQLNHHVLLEHSNLKYALLVLLKPRQIPNLHSSVILKANGISDSLLCQLVWCFYTLHFITPSDCMRVWVCVKIARKILYWEGSWKGFSRAIDNF